MLVGPDAPYLDAALESLKSQTFQDFELLEQHEPGIVLARNEGCRRARGEYIAIQDADDISFPCRFEKQTRFLDHFPTVSVVGSWCNLMGRWDLTRGGLRRSRVMRTPESVSAGLNFMWARMPNSAAMMRKADVMPFGPYRNVLLEDYDLWIRLLRGGKRMCNIQEPLVALRAHESNHSKSIPQAIILKEEIRERLSCFFR